MAITIVMPRMGYDMQEARIVQWLKAEGDAVNLGDDLAEIETDKAIIPLPAPASGALLRRLADEGDMVPVGQLLAVLGAPGETVPPELLTPAAAPAPAPADADAPPTPPHDAPGRPQPGSTTDGQPAPVRASPIARRLAGQHGIDLASVTGTGPGGRVTEADVTNAVAAGTAGAPAAPASAGGDALPLSRMRLAIARLTAQSKRDIPHFYISIEISADPALDLRARVNPILQERQVRISLHDMVVKACADALANYPTLNASFAGNALHLHDAVNIGVVIDMDREGLLVPALLNCQGQTLLEISSAGRDLVRRAKENALRPEELTGATFCVSNLAALGVHSAAAIIHPPNAAILAVGAVRKEPVVRDDAIVIGQRMHCTLSVDHRVEDGMTAARFLGDIKRLLEQPQSLLPEDLRGQLQGT